MEWRFQNNILED